MLLSVAAMRICCRRCYATDRLRLEDLVTRPPDPSKPAPPQTPPKFFTGRIARWTGAPKITEGWDMTKEHYGDLFRAMMMGTVTRGRVDPQYRLLGKVYQRIKVAQAYDPALVNHVGIELAATAKLISLGCRISFTNSPGDWLGPSEGGSNPSQPLMPVPGLGIEAIDARDASLMTDSVDWIGRLRSLQFLRLRRCPFVDDHFLAKVATRCSSLKVLEVSACPGVSWEGIASLWRLTKLRRLVLSENIHLLSQPAAMAIVPAQLEALVPGLFVEGVEDLAALSVQRPTPGDPECAYAE